MQFQYKNVILTGASSGIGYSLAKLLPKENCSLALLARRKQILDQITNDPLFAGKKINAYKCDVSKYEEVVEVFSEVKNDFGSIDIAILNAGTSSRAGVKEYSAASGKEIFDVNTLGLIYCIEQLLPGFMNKKEGMIVGVSSLSDVRGFPRSGFYSASKSAASLMLESLRVELKPYNVKVLTIKPGFVKTPMTDKNEFHMPFMMKVDKAAEIILRGIKKEKKNIQFPLPIVLGAKLIKIMPDRLFDYLAGLDLPKKKS